MIQSTGDLERIPPQAVALGHGSLIGIRGCGVTRVARFSTNDAELSADAENILT